MQEEAISTLLSRALSLPVKSQHLMSGLIRTGDTGRRQRTGCIGTFLIGHHILLDKKNIIDIPL